MEGHDHGDGAAPVHVKDPECAEAKGENFLMVLGTDGVEVLADLQAGEAEPLVAGIQGGLQGPEAGEDVVGRGGGLEGLLEVGHVIRPPRTVGGEGNVGVGDGLEGAGGASLGGDQARGVGERGTSMEESGEVPERRPALGGEGGKDEGSGSSHGGEVLRAGKP